MEAMYGKTVMVIGLTIWIITVFTISGVNASDPGQLIKIGSCSCPEDTVVYQCTVNASSLGGFTIWRGTAFDCPGVQNRVLLRHNSYQNGGAFGQCGDAIVGRSLRVDPDFVYVSQLEINITTNPELIGRTVECVYNPSGDTIVTINSTTVNVEAPPSPPRDVRLTGVTATNLDFTWTSEQTDCSNLRYVVASDCGHCAVNSNLETEQPKASCSFQPPSTVGGNACTLSVQSVICRNLSSTLSVPVSVNLRVPGPPTINSVVPVYQIESSRGLQSVLVNFSEAESFDISNGVKGSALYYILTASDSISGAVCVLYNVTPSSCEGGVCVISLDDLTSCLSGTDTGTVTITVNAHNWLGNGPSSSRNLNKTSQDVIVSVETATRIVCTYSKQLSMQNPSNKSCDMSYGSCDQSVATYTTVQGRVNSSTTVNIDLFDGITPGSCYVINASYDSQTVQFQGTYNVYSQGSISPGIIVGIVVLLVVALVLVLLAVLVAVVYTGLKRRTSASEESEVSLMKKSSLTDECVYAHIIMTIEDELKELVRVLQVLSPYVNIKNIKVCRGEPNQLYKKKVYIQNDQNLSDDEIKKINYLKQSGLPFDTLVYPSAQFEQISEDKDSEHNPQNQWTITETLKHTSGALCALLKTFQQMEECRHINITDIIHDEVPGQKHLRQVTIKFYPDLPRNWKQKFDHQKKNCAFIEL